MTKVSVILETPIFGPKIGQLSLKSTKVNKIFNDWAHRRKETSS